MERSTPWRTIKLETGGPQVLVKTRADDKGYDIQLTDLSRVWGERLDREAIGERAAQLRCSIEPGEQDQYEKFIEKIVDALESKKGTTLDLKSTSKGLSLQLSAPLPKPLSPFKWNVEVSRLPDSFVAAELVSPLLRQANTLQHQIQQLVDELAAKDHVISKVTDRLEQSKSQLQEIFPTVSNVKLNTKSKKSQREQLSGHVKGLAAFDEDSWRDSTASAEVAEDLSADLLDVVFKDAPAHGRSDDNRHAENGEWWTTLDSTQASLFGSQSGSKHHNADSKPVVPQLRNNEENSDMQSPAKPKTRNTTPSTDDEEPRADSEHSSAQPTTVQPIDEDDTTEDEDDLDAVPKLKGSQSEKRSHNQRVATADSEPVRKPRKLGAMGGKKASGPTLDIANETSPEPAPKKASKLGAFGGRKKATTPDTDRDLSAQGSEGHRSPPAKPKARLGAFGGKSKEAPRSSSPEPPATSSPKPKSKLGTFGGRSKKEDSARAQNDVDEAHPSPALAAHSRSTSLSAEPQAERQSRPTEKEKVEQERENSEERADKKRERLKRELEERSKVPAKKKRKF